MEPVYTGSAMAEGFPMKVLTLFRSRFQKGEIWKLFLVVCAPVHFWAIFMALQDLEWIVGRSYFWEFIGYLGYILVIAFLESALLTGVLILAGLLLPQQWQEGKNLAVLSLWALAVLLAGIANQYYFFLDINPKTSSHYLLRLLDYIHYYDKLVFCAVVLVSLLAAALPPVLAAGFEKFTRGVLGLVERISVLSAIFLFLDAAGLLVVIYRNLSNMILL
jgi:hypothetical protein